MQKRSRRHNSNSKRGGRQFSLLNLCLLTLFTLLSAYLVFMVITYNMLGFRAVNWILYFALGLIFITSLVLLLSGRAKWFNRILLMVSTLLVAFGAYAVKSTVDFANQLNYTASFSRVDLSVVVAKDSSVESVQDLATLLTAANDEKNTEKVLTSLADDKGLSPKTEEVASYQEAYEAILADKTKGMVLNSAYVSLLELMDADFSDKVKTIYTTSVQETVQTKSEEKEKQTDNDVFNVYISGIDSYGSISSVSRSDVNLIMTVNRKTNKILITTTPRDSYVQIAGGGNNQYDKLTHSGIYGINSSIQTLENLYGIDIDYYVRLNFTSFLQIIDLIGGVEVFNEQSFTSIHSGRTYSIGNLSLNSEQALDFVRERYGLEGGDDDRGKNQEKVLAAVIKKLTSASSLTNLPNIVASVSDSVQTNMPLATLMTLVNDQIDQKNDYTIVTQAVEGTGSTGQLTSYAMPNASLYMVSLDSNSLTSAKAAINNTMEGK